MKRAALVPHWQQPTLCIFCAARTAQRRPFHARPRCEQQVGAAFKQRPEQLDQRDQVQNSEKPTAAASKPASEAWGGEGGGWSNDGQNAWRPPVSDAGTRGVLSAEEQRIRQNLQKSVSPPPTRIVQLRNARGYNGQERRNDAAQEPPVLRIRRINHGDGTKDTIHDQNATSRPSYRTRRHDPFEQPSQVASAPSEQASHWKHLRFRGAQDNEPPISFQTSNQAPGISAQQRVPRSSPQYARDSQMRQEQTRDGQFVRLTKSTDRTCWRCGQHGHEAKDCFQEPEPRMFQAAQKVYGQEITQIPNTQQTFPAQQFKSQHDFRPRPVADWAKEEIKSPERPATQEKLETYQPEQQERRAPDDAQDESRKARTSSRFASVDAYEDAAPRRRDDDKRKLRNIQYARDAAAKRDEEEERAERRRQKDLRRAQKSSSAQKNTKQVSIPEFISIGHLATLLSVRLSQFERSLKRLGFSEVNHDHVLNAEDASLIAQEYDFDPIIERASEDEDLHAAPEPEDKTSLPQRPPVVTIMGHVDHGKTTILDFLRKSSIAAGEHGGITQHIGAFSVPMASGSTITFLDTPGHAAFLTMRQRGANVTDIVVLVVAADDSVMPQTLESIKCAKTAGVPMIVAINKMDKEDAAPDRVKQDLARYGVEVEDFGGDTQVVYVSGKTGLGMEDLEESISTLSEILDQRADVAGVAEGWILEASTKKSGRVATILVRRGTLKVGDIIVAGTTWARVRTMRNEYGELVEYAGPGTPVEIDGWRDQPAAGDEVLQAPDEQKATAVTGYRLTLIDQVKAAKDMEAINETRWLEAERRAAEEVAEAGGDADPDAAAAAADAKAVKGPQEVHFVIKGDVSGSVEAVINQVSAIGNAEIRPVILHSAVGPITQSDVEYAAIAKGAIIAFNTSTESGVRGQAEKAGVTLIEQSIIYRVTDDVKALLESKLPPEMVTKVTGEAEILQPFSINIEKRKFLRIAGSKIKNGTVSLRNKAKVLRGGEVIYTGTITSLKNKRQDAQDMRKGNECGIAFDGWEGFEIGDQIQCFEETERRRTL